MEEPRLEERRRERRFHNQGELLIESVRRLTFANWRVAFVDPDDLAKSGFFYLRTLDHVQCVFCNGVVGYWEPGDEPDKEHKKHFPECPHMIGATTGNVASSTSHDDAGRVFSLLEDYHAFRMTCTRPLVKNTNYQNDATRIEPSQVSFPQLNTPTARKQTYQTWPKDTGVEPDALVAAGFFSVGVSDWVRCFYCGGGLFGWREGDDPAADHLRYYPSCTFIRSRDVQDKLNLSLGDNVPPSAHIRTVFLSDKEADLLLAHPIAKRLIDMGLSSISVKKALISRVESKGIMCCTVTEAIQEVFDYDEKQRRQKTLQDDYKPNNEHESVNGKVPDLPDVSSATPLTNGNDIVVIDDSYRTLQIEVNELRKLVMREEGKLKCRECKSRRAAVVLQPCSHLHLCSTCARPRDTCPSCGSIVRGTLRPILN